MKLIENIQKVALKIILGDFYISYDVACTLFSVSPLEYRRTDLSTNFAIKLYRSPRSSEFFEPAIKIVNTRSDQQLLVAEKTSNTKRCQNAPHNYLARIINQNKTKIEKMKWCYCMLQFNYCYLWTIGARLSFLFCNNFLLHRIITFCSSP